MKILHLCLSNHYVDHYSYQENMLPKYHRKMGYEVAVVASLATYDEDGNYCHLNQASSYFCEDGYQVTRLNYRGPFKRLNIFLRRYEGTYQAIVSEQPSIIFIHGLHFWDIHYVAKYVKRNPHVKVYVDNHADRINSARNWLSYHVKHKIIWRFCAKRIRPYVETFYGVAPVRCEFLIKAYKVPAEKTRLLVMGADDEIIKFDQKEHIRKSLRNKHSIGESDFVIITGGKINSKKNIHLLMRAVNELDQSNVTLIVFGAVDDQMSGNINELAKSERIRYIGWIDSKEAYDYFLASDLAFFPGTHSVLWEQAVGTGIPAVFKFWKGMQHIDLGGNCVFMYDESVDEIKSILKEVTVNRTLYQRMKKVAVEKGIEYFSYSEIAKKALNVN